MTLEQIDDPERQKVLQDVCEKQYRGWLFGGEYRKAASQDTVGETLEEIERERKKLMEKHEGYMRQAELAKQQAKFMTDPAMREITENLKRKHSAGGLICPVCGGREEGNRMNGKPWCMKCNAPLMTLEKAIGWVKPEKHKKPSSHTFNEPEDVMRWRR